MKPGFIYERRSPPAGSGWSAYPLGTELLSRSDRLLLDDFFRSHLRYEDIPEGVPWIGRIPLDDGRSVVLWRAREESGVRGMLVEPGEAGHAPGTLLDFFREIDSDFLRRSVRGFAKEFTAEDRWESVDNPRAERDRLSDAFKDEADVEGFVSDWKKGVRLPRNVSACASAANAMSGHGEPPAASGPTLEELARSLNTQTLQRAELEERVRTLESAQPLLSDLRDRNAQAARRVSNRGAFTFAAAMNGVFAFVCVACTVFVVRTLTATRSQIESAQRAINKVVIDAKKSAVRAENAIETKPAVPSGSTQSALHGAPDSGNAVNSSVSGENDSAELGKGPSRNGVEATPRKLHKKKDKKDNLQQ